MKDRDYEWKREDESTEKECSNPRLVIWVVNVGLQPNALVSIETDYFDWVLHSAKTFLFMEILQNTYDLLAQLKALCTFSESSQTKLY